jgi:hypothetical protein
VTVLGDIWQCLDTFRLTQLEMGSGESSIGVRLVATRYDAQHPTMHGTAP